MCMLFRRSAVLLLLAAAGCHAAPAPAASRLEPKLQAIRLPAADGAIAATCSLPAHDLGEARRLVDTLARALARSGTPAGPYVVVPLPSGRSPRLASFAMRGDTAVISVGVPVGGHSLYHELIHAWAARLSPEAAREMVDLVFAADSGAGWPGDVSRWAVASYLSVIGGLGHPSARGFTEMALSVTTGSLDTTSSGRLRRVLDATDPIVDRARGLGGAGRTIGESLDAVSEAHWRYAGHRRPRWWDAGAEREFILASELLAYARERTCLGLESFTNP